MKIPKKVHFLTLVILLSSGLMSCANRAPSLRMLDDRAEYTEEEKARLGLSDLEFVSPEGEKIPIRSQSKIATVWIHRHELPSGDMFWGGWASLIYATDVWQFSDAKAVSNQSKTKGSVK